jgi:NADPH:quinone reductase-like Zn-dependent oxidoreductase
MHAVVQDSYGPAEVLELRDIDRPVVGEAEVLLQGRAAGVDPGVWHLMTGRPYLVRIMATGGARPRPASEAGTSPGGWRGSAPT